VIESRVTRSAPDHVSEETVVIDLRRVCALVTFVAVAGFAAPLAVAGEVADPAAASSSGASTPGLPSALPPEVRPTSADVSRLVADVGTAAPVATAYRCGGSCGCDDPCVPACPRWSVTLGAWIWGTSGTLGADGRTVDVDSDWTDTLEMADKLEFALNARVRGEFGRWSATVEVDGATISDTATFREGNLGVDATVSAWMLQAQVGYHLTGGPLGCGECAPIGCLGVYAGLRASWIGLELAASQRGAAVDRSLEWVDPIVGLRGDVRFPNGWFGTAEFDIGGFGIGSDFAWHLLGAVGYRFSDSFAVEAGWKIVDSAYADGDRIWDVRMSGPFLAFTFTF
jgi:hypothetical protein